MARTKKQVKVKSLSVYVLMNSKMAGSPFIWIFTTMAGELTSH